MTVRIEKSGSVWTVIHSRPEARNAMDAASADALVAAFEQFDADQSADVAVFWGEGGAFCAGWDLKRVSSLDQGNPVGRLDFPKDGGKAPRGPLGPSRLEMSQARDRRGRGPGGGRRHGAGHVGRRARDGRERLLRRLLPALGRAVDRRRHRAPAAPRRHGQGARDHHDGAQGARPRRCYRIGLCEKVVPHGKAREAAEAMAQEIARFPQECMRADRLSAYRAWGKSVREGLESEWATSAGIVKAEGIAGADPLRLRQRPPRRLQEYLTVIGRARYLSSRPSAQIRDPG